METLVWKEITDWDQNVEDEALARKALKSLVIHLSRPSKALGERSRSNCYANFVDSSSTMRRNVGRKQTNPSAAAAFTAKLLAKPPNRRQRNLHKNPSRKLGDDQTITSSTSPYLHRRPLHQSTQHSQQTPPQPHIINSNQSNIINRERVLVLIEKLALAESEKEQYQIQVKEMVATREILERELESTRIEFEKLQQQHDGKRSQFLREARILIVDVKFLLM